MRDRVLELPVIENTSLRESRIRTNAGYLGSAPTEQNLRRGFEQLGVAIVEKHVETAITEASFVGRVRGESVRPVDERILNQAGHVNFRSRKLQRRELRHLIGEDL